MSSYSSNVKNNLHYHLLLVLVLNMINNKITAAEVLQILGERLKKARLDRNETQEVFASRIGLTRQSYAKMERGAGSVPISNWLEASNILGRLDSWNAVLDKQTDLFEDFEKKQQKKKRAGRKKAARGEGT